MKGHQCRCKPLKGHRLPEMLRMQGHRLHRALVMKGHQVPWEAWTDPITAALMKEITQLFKLYDRHLMRQKTLIHLARNAESRKQQQVPDTDEIQKPQDHVYLWYCRSKQEKTQEERDRVNTLGIQMQNGELILIS